MLSRFIEWLNGAGVSAEAPVFVFTNENPGTIIHLGDGRKLRFGESAEVTPAIHAILSQRQADA